MQRLIIPDSYPEKFIYKYLPDIFYQVAARRLYLHRKSRMNSYIKKNYDLEITDIVNLLKLIKIDKYEHTYVMHFDIDDKVGDIRIRELLHLISYGNREVQGLHVVDNTFDYIATNIGNIYRIFIIEENIQIERDKQKGFRA